MWNDVSNPQMWRPDPRDRVITKNQEINKQICNEIQTGKFAKEWH
jgi:ketol-acid reductoisomerase